MNEKTAQIAVQEDILVVDDDPENLAVLMSVLELQGYRVRPVSTGAMALCAAKMKAPDLILLDINMPEMDGFEVCQRLKADPRLHAIPVLFLTADSQVEEKVKAFALGGRRLHHQTFLDTGGAGARRALPAVPEERTAASG